ncbi:tRNA dimethylallyltransferase [BD1-7 clade bacterium]|uniref:tRNA dimethylallyltransferase n=1 Tax=BD1-7 clade bacterium TaxID=2029982 RepID=A0A5S9N3R7_9GAMM|nr:tRNA dimethylallyltransferase [BD1-7 clade bacterium]CAA0082557.1 tRNA dimethylallyltransferase [BD1-7 clade bacterium]
MPRNDCANKPPVVFIMGPTASGKTDLAMRLSDEFNGEIVSVDSALIYRNMNIGTAKPSRLELQAYPHHLVDIVDPSEAYSAAQFREDALQLLADIHSRGRLPILAGGSMMYFRVLLEGMSQLPQADSAVRHKIEQIAAEHGWQEVHRQLAEVDSESAARIHPNDPQRLQRALEVYLLSGRSMTQHRIIEQQQRAEFPFAPIQIALAPDDRAILHQRIAERFEKMLSNGFEQEVRALFDRGDLNAGMPSIRCVGYRQMWSYLEKEISYDQMREKGVIATRQLAKRQFTWLRGWQDLNWIYTSFRDEALSKPELLDRLQQNASQLISNQLK